ncbi:MAG: MarR family transcriptional regulator [Gracilimonas sp.]|uniref:MarR family winged helix-turn-helix transcriptional regulator n=1 Tax=Gracilimonas TaxID=649462 RepID=UPI001B0FFCD6|nr:MarR family transcriptional regulator [Gracilimonas sp.]MBO6584845.1 MarR family transcriptional regulator [Gracilimonas sp.]MBO6615884.1 MarR family transcriptional regulator [Gracilimonas sp.]
MGTHYDGTDEEKSTLNAFIKLMRASESLNGRLSRHLSDGNLTVSQFGTLEALLHLGPLNQRELGQKLLKSGGNITLVIDNLQKNGLVEKKTDPNDRRAVIINLTKKGRSFIEEFFPQHLDKIKEEFSCLSIKEKEQLAGICKKLGQKPE